MVRDDEAEHIHPGPSASDDPVDLRHQERNAFYASLAPEAKDRFLAALEDAETRGLDEETAWREAVVAAETTYPEHPEGARLPPVKRTDET